MTTRGKIRYKPDNLGYRRPYAPEEKAEILTALSKYRKGNSVRDCSFILQIPETTLYRWSREAEEDGKRPTQRFDALEKTNKAIATLCSRTTCNRWERLEAVFRFGAWLRWPCSSQYHDVAVAACLASYLSQTTGAGSVSDLTGEAKNLLTNNLHLQTLARLCSDELRWDAPSWMPFNKYIEPVQNDERDLLAEIVWSIIAIGKNNTNNRLSGSLSKAFFLVKNHLLRSSIVAPGMIHKWWRENAPAAPFLYVERYHSGLDWRFDPTSDEFVPQVDDIVSNQPGLLLYFMNSKFVSDALRTILSPRVSRNTATPNFPNELASEAISPPALSRVIVDALKSYKS